MTDMREAIIAEWKRRQKAKGGWLLDEEEAADAAITALWPLAMEEAAKVADEYATWHNKMDDGLSGFDKMALGAEEVAAAIRAGAVK